MPLIFRWKIIFIVSYQTMKYKFNYTPLVKFLNFIVWYDTMKTSTLERQSISICSRQGPALIPPPSRVIFAVCQGEKDQLPTCSIIALSPSVTRLWSGSSLLLMPIVVGALWTPFGIIESVSSTRLIRIQAAFPRVCNSHFSPSYHTTAGK